ncbi:MAG: polymer-forming cytoskeletal protein [Alphaproteobacteria bacterium]|nr:MAG: polymer-forming cytoskeletal protein [Alphaproteobacteria bacterium]
MPPRTPEAARQGGEAARPAEAPRRPAEVPANPVPAVGGLRRSETDVRTLIVGREISLSGEINSCNKLVVEGSVKANLQNCRDVDISETGLFKGSASIDEAEVRGRFEGNLTVRKRLLIRSTGKVTGTIRYGQIEIECGGQISGDIQAQGHEDLIAAVPAAPAAD